jgi:hypothetical protein
MMNPYITRELAGQRNSEMREQARRSGLARRTRKTLRQQRRHAATQRAQ